MAMVLQQALRGLCYKSGWSYAVFWKLKRRSRMVLTWEDGFYEFSKPSAVSSFDSMQTTGGFNMMNSGRPGTDPLAPDVPGAEDEIGLAVARMSYHVYSLGEGIIGRVAFTGKHQWVFGERGSTGEGTGTGRSTGRAINEKYPAGWQQQFTAGIKTIAVVAVPQGVVQLGSTQIVMEDLTLVSHVRGLFGTLQSVPGAFLSDYVPDSQGGRVHVPCSVVMPLPMLIPMGATNETTRSANVTHLHPGQLSMNNVPQIPTTAVVSGSYDLMNLCKASVPARAHLSNPFRTSSVNPLSLQTSRIMPSPHVNKDSTSSNNSLLSTVSMAVGNRKGLSNIPFTSVHCAPSTESASVASLGSGNWNSPPAMPSVAQSKTGGLFDRRLHADHRLRHQLQTSLPVCGVKSYQDTVLTTTKGPSQQTSICVTSSPITTGGGVDCKPTRTFGQEAFRAMESCNTESTLKTAGFTGGALDTKGLREQSQLYNRNHGELLQGQSRRSSPNVEMSNLEMPSKACLTAPTEGLLSHAGKWAHTVTTGPHSEVTKVSVNNVSQSDDKRNTNTYSQVREDEKVCKQVYVQSPPKFADVAGFSNQSVPISKGSGSSLQGIQVCTEGGRNVQVRSQISDRAWNESPKAEWDCFSGLLNPFPIGDELSQALRPASLRECDRDLFSNLHPVHVPDDVRENSSVKTVGETKLLTDSGEGKCARNTVMDYDIFQAISDAVLMDSRSEPLLEAMVAGVSNAPSAPSPSKVGSCSHEPNLSGGNSTLSGEPESMRQRNDTYRSGSSGDTLEYDTAGGISPCKTEMEYEKFASCGIDFQRESMLKASQNSMRMSGDEGQKRSDDELAPYDNVLPAKRQEEFGKVANSRKRPKLGDTLRPRPKDRQQIQDRVRELREIVPNACKCSIDSLLERTIRHMHFLQSVTQHGGNWKNFGGLKEEEDAECLSVDCKAYPDMQGGEKEKSEVGPICDLKFDKPNNGCPIVVENTNQPRQMLVEMLCEERGLFLEIAETVRGLGLTILKGAMESRSGKTWARFVVEATSRDIHRVEVLWYLMQLIQPTSALLPSYGRPSNFADPGCLYGAAHDSTSGSMTSSFPHMLRPSVPLQMTAR
ncbi:protein MpBHLH19 [Marchantia polymorpha subsp. ruderalis]|uniref:BHLH domain-containing protein n=2 Tax=Marchantia polymorpha TaxID=3197 RepID=A0AAF6BVD3_MARPO|nr:hypothetical protein MARPO_0088s0049 [Marchantia polymorpha]BBN15967.1 hypothetical protein Mp_7g02370 [Marchantia polymorpha subsp. ruderalis]|eukprot:PTQ33503.1 hypothetical protein MARPO_0088s0049 [Marchantia polymorpha]